MKCRNKIKPWKHKVCSPIATKVKGAEFDRNIEILSKQLRFEYFSSGDQKASETGV